MRAILRRLAGRNPRVRAYARLALRSVVPDREPEIRILEFLAARGETVIDVGANVGLYITPLLRMGCRVVAFEANPAIAHELDLMYGSKIRVIHAAASNVSGTATMRVPDEVVLGGLGTIEPENTLPESHNRTFEVPTVTIDSLGLTDVALIKIDVEGHELAVLQGAEQLLRTQRPRLIIEAENRHRENAVASIFEFLGGLNYEGFMLVDGLLASIRTFDPARHQSVAEISVDALNHHQLQPSYVYNFVFLPA